MNKPVRDGDTQGCHSQHQEDWQFGRIYSAEGALARLKLKEGDKFHIVEQTERGIKLSPYDPKHAEAMEIARRSFRKYADTYKALAE